MRVTAPVLVLLGVVAFASPVQGDWHPGDDHKWVQLPDLSTTGIDVDVSDKTSQPEYNCADDFLCTLACPITEIHLWGSWKLDDYPYAMSPDAVTITLTIHADIPAEESPTGYSIPGQQLWSRTFNQGEFVVEDWSTGTPEWWWTPGADPLYPGDTNCWQYNFTIDAGDAFFQVGTPEEPMIYWLAVQATPNDWQPAVKFGWKTSLDHWNDAAAWALSGPAILWNQLLYPQLHPMAEERMDLAFVINGYPATLDFGDAPDPSYPTLLASDGARHTVVPGVYLGHFIDAELDGQPDPAALGDDTHGIDDEDGVWYTTPIIPLAQARLVVHASVPGYVSGWVDFDADGDWGTDDDHILSSVPVPAGGTSLVVNTPLATVGATTLARFRFTTDPDSLSYTGPAVDGEVVDFSVQIVEGEVYDWGDAPAPYPTLAADNGPSHRISAGLCLGWRVDGEFDGQPHPAALGDDCSNFPDEDGVWPNSLLYPGQVAEYSLLVTGNGYVSAWFDFENDGDWDDPTDLILFDYHVVDGWNSFTFPVPETAAAGEYVFGRFRFTHCPGGLGYTGASIDGEVEDERVSIREWCDWGDAPDPYPTRYEDNGARHPVVPGIYLGQGIDQDVDGQPSWDALDDDRNGVDDEDGVRFLRPLIPGRDTSIEVTASADGYVTAWIDFNADGSWAEPNDRILNSSSVAAGTTAFTVQVPADASENMSTFARFRFTTHTGETLSYTGSAVFDGEVEDYRVRIDPAVAFDTKWIQYPDLDPTGMGVSGSYGLTLADDFECTEPGRLAELAVWGAWFNNYLPNGNPYGVRFVLSIYEDIPAGQSPTGYSMPGDLLWQRHYLPGDYDAEIWVPEVLGAWLDPSDGAYWFPGDSMCWLYSFHTPPSVAFHQTGTPDAPVVYWLSVTAYPFDTDAMWGWKTSVEHWNDDGVYAVAGDPWGDLVYPPEHPMAGESVDLAFAVRNTYGTGVPEGGEPEEVIPERFGLRQNIPNPFNPVTTIGYDVPAGGGKVTIEVFDVSGRLVRALVDGFEEEGVRTVTWDGRDASGAHMGSGVYFCRMTAGSEQITVKMTLLE